MLRDTFGSRNRTAVSAAMRIVGLTKWWMNMNMEMDIMDNKHMQRCNLIKLINFHYIFDC